MSLKGGIWMERKDINGTEFGTYQYFALQYKQKLDEFLPQFLEEQLEKITSQQYEDKEVMLSHLSELGKFYNTVKKEFEKRTKK